MTINVHVAVWARTGIAFAGAFNHRALKEEVLRRYPNVSFADFNTFSLEVDMEHLDL
jgi:hypothetical protein